jgi:hypothetical protein
VPCFSAFGGQQFFVKKQTTINQNISQNTNKNKLASLQKQGAKEEERGLGEEQPRLFAQALLVFHLHSN